MSNAETSALGRRRARLVRWLGWDRNPLRWPADRIEAALRLAVLILILTAVPAVTVIAGRTADHLFLRTAQSQQAADHRVDAVLTQAAPADVIDPYVAVETTWAPARWTAPDGFRPLRSGPRRSRCTERQHGADLGQLLRRRHRPPAGHNDVTAEVAVTVALTYVILTGTLLGARGLAQRTLDRRRFRAWDAEWCAVGPHWTGHRT